MQRGEREKGETGEKDEERRERGGETDEGIRGRSWGVKQGQERRIKETGGNQG